MRRTRTADVSLHDDWCVVVTIHAGATQTLEDARENLEGAIAACGEVRRPLLVDISRCTPLEPEVRHYYTGKQLVAAFHALALVVEATPFGYVVGNLYLRVARPGIPTRLCAEREAAFGWLRTYLS